MASTPADSDDYALSPVPPTARYAWFPVAVQRFGQLSALPVFLLGALIGVTMDFWSAVLAITLGSVLLEVISILVGIIGVRTGLNTSLLARWTGFGAGGSALIGLVVAVSLIGWFGVQTAVAGAGLAAIWPALPAWGWAIFFGLAVTGIVLRGFASMQWVANVSVPVFLLLVGWSVISEFSKHDLGEVMQYQPPAGGGMSVVQGATIVAGAFMAGAIITPDMTRFNRSAADVVKQTVVGVTVGEYVVGLCGVLLAQAAKTADITSIIMGSVGFVGVLILIFGTFKINDWNLYGGGLGIVNFIDTVAGRSAPRALVSAIVGVLGTAVAAVAMSVDFAGFTTFFNTFLTYLAVVFPPIAGVMIAEYFVVKTWRADLDDAIARGHAPGSAPRWVPASLIAWVAGALVGHFVTWGIPSLSAILVAFLLYWVGAKLGLARGYGSHATTRATPATRPAAATR